MVRCRGKRGRHGLGDLGAGHAVARGEPGGVVVAEPDRAVGILERQRLQRQVDPDRLPRLHQRRAALGVAENQKLGRPQRQARLVGALGVIDAREHLHALRGHVGREPVDGVLDAVCTFDRHQAIVSHCSRSLRQARKSAERNVG